MNAERGYRKETFIRLLMKHSPSSLFIIHVNLIRCQFFVERYLLYPFRDDIEEKVVDEEENTDAVFARYRTGQILPGIAEEFFADAGSVVSDRNGDSGAGEASISELFVSRDIRAQSDSKRQHYNRR